MLATQASSSRRKLLNYSTLALCKRKRPRTKMRPVCLLDTEGHPGCRSLSMHTIHSHLKEQPSTVGRLR
jgi:hypothetical protein